MSSKAKTQLNREEWARLTDLYEQAMRVPAPDRVRWAKNAIPDDKNLTTELLFLIENSSAEDFLETPVGPRLAEAFDPKRAMEDYEPGKSVADFQIVRLLGVGSFAKVMLARQVSLDREVALKISPIVGNQSNEAKTLAHLEHDHIIKVFSEWIDHARSLRVICMQYVPGTGIDHVTMHLRAYEVSELTGKSFLDAVDKLGPTATSFNPAAMKDRDTLAGADYVEACLWLGSRLADALSYAHDRGVLHLDVKPSNILISLYGRPHLTDFNVALDARTVEGGGAQSFGGTFNYMPPEQRAVFEAEDKRRALTKVDKRADVYSLAVVVRELLTGFPAGSPESQERLPLAHSELDPATDPMPTEVAHLIDRAMSPDPEDRFRDAGDLARAFEGASEIRNIAKALPAPSSLMRFCLAHPLLSLTLIGGVPQFIASYMGIMYNTLRIVSMLTPEQQYWFRQLNLTYNPVIYTIGTLIWVVQIMRLRGYLNNPTPWRSKPKALAKLRRFALSLPYWGVAVTTFGWVPGSIVFPLVLHVKAGPLPVVMCGHFLVSFLLSWLIAMSYSFLFHQLLVLRVLYPRFWIGGTDIRKTARAELAGFRLRFRLFNALTGFIPLVAAALLIFVGPDRLDSSSYASFRLLVSFLMGLGILGVFFALSLSNLLSQALFAFTGVESSRAARK